MAFARLFFDDFDTGSAGALASRPGYTMQYDKVVSSPDGSQVDPSNSCVVYTYAGNIDVEVFNITAITGADDDRAIFYGGTGTYGEAWPTVRGTTSGNYYSADRITTTLYFVRSDSGTATNISIDATLGSLTPPYEYSLRATGTASVLLTAVFTDTTKTFSDSAAARKQTGVAGLGFDGLGSVGSKYYCGYIGVEREYAFDIGPEADSVDGEWLPSTGTDLYAVLDETTASDTDFAYSFAESAMRVKIGTVKAATINFRIRAVGSGHSATIRVYSGATKIDEWTETGLTNTYSLRARVLALTPEKTDEIYFEVLPIKAV
jgi:hypothetical protein